MSSSNCCFLTCIQIYKEAGQVVWYSHLLKNFPQFIVIHTVKGFGIVNKAEIDVFLELSCFFHDPADVGNLISGSSAFSKTSLNKSLVAFNFIENNFVSLYCNSYHISMHLIRQWNWWVFVAILMSKMEEKKQHFSILWFIISKKVKTPKKICEVYGEDSVADWTYQKWFVKFLVWDFFLHDAPHLVDQLKLIGIKLKHWEQSMLYTTW